ncbi:MAG: permease [Omnitrophica WOR_2 bacterium GWA2_45_18]|nr:MAG: permease [Omnitrophica WOR_2 bacterium GWA2_45_18]
MVSFLYVAVGLISGVMSGAFGIGGGTIMVPLLVLIFGLTQHQAQGTSLAVMLPPVFLLAVMRYYAAGHIKVQMAVFIGLGFILGALIGAHFVQGIPDAALKKAFGVFLIVIGLRMVFFK